MHKEHPRPLAYSREVEKVTVRLKKLDARYGALGVPLRENMNLQRDDNSVFVNEKQLAEYQRSKYYDRLEEKSRNTSERVKSRSASEILAKSNNYVDLFMTESDQHCNT